MWKAPEKSFPLFPLFPLEIFDSQGFLREEDLEFSMKKSKKVPALFSFSHPQPRQIVKPNDFPAVPLPKPGSSYNPDAEQHQDLIGEQLVQEKHYSDMMKKERTLMNGMTKADLFSQRIPANVLSVGRGIGF